MSAEGEQNFCSSAPCRSGLQDRLACHGLALHGRVQRWLRLGRKLLNTSSNQN